MMIKDFIDAMVSKDYKALSQCFCDQSRMFDYCPAARGLSNYYVYGSRAIDMFYHNKFFLGGYTIYDPEIVDERTVNFYASYSGGILHAVASIEAYDKKTGLIKELVIRPA